MRTTSNVMLTHPDRILYPDCGVTKADVAAYIQAASPLMLPHMEGRFISLVRCPNGTDKPCFFQRHLMPGFGGAWRSAEFSVKDGERKSFIYFDQLEALSAAVQMGVLEFHIWGARRTAPEKPDRMVFDLDPDPSVAFASVKAAAFHIRDVLEALGLQSLPLLSGGKGIHVVVPLVPSHEWPIVKDFAAALAARLVTDAPDQFTATMSKAKRKGKIFIDHFRNENGATAIAPFSPRARPDAAIAWPVSWAELETIEAANAVTIPTAQAAIEKGTNFWADYDKINRTLPMAAIKWVSHPS
jgi:bifunctional non-homologous end joining protein LigD